MMPPREVRAERAPAEVMVKSWETCAVCHMSLVSGVEVVNDITQSDKRDSQQGRTIVSLIARTQLSQISKT